jgi:ABC-2 type transport system ATP-binding protein
MLHFTKLDAHRRKLAEHLSGGMQKRLDLSCSLIHKPKILILDEPTADLDPVLQEEILYLLEEVNKQGVTIVIASHHLGSVEKLCNKVAIVHDGKVPAFGLIEDVKKPFISDHFTINVHSSSKTKERIINRFKECPVKRIIDKGNKIIVYPNHVERTVSQLLNLIQEEGLQLNDMDIRHPSLNEIFERIVQE